MTTSDELDGAEIERVVARLTPTQKRALLAIRSGEERRAIDFSASSANSLCNATRAGGALLRRTLTANGQVCWYAHTRAGLAVRAYLARTERRVEGGGA